MTLSLYRKYRSQTFDELVGQEPVVKTLKNAIATDRIGHAYLFTGPRGVGKTSAARLLARAANCLSERPDKPCNDCSNCLAASRELATDLIEIDAASNTGVDNIRDLIERAQFAPAVWRTKFYIIDETHMLSVSAFNALLKTLEEPPPHVAFILATTEVHKVPATVASRCQRFDFRRVPLRAMLDRLEWICDQEGIDAEPEALELVARQATGSLRDALSLLDQLRVFSEGAITLAEVQDMLGASGAGRVADFVDHITRGDLASGLRLINEVLDEGLDVRQFNRQTVEHLRQLLLIKTGAAQAADTTLIDATEEMKRRMDAQAAQVAVTDLLRWTRVFAEADSELRTTTYRQLPMEMALVEAVLPPGLASPPSDQPVRDHSAEIAAGVGEVGLSPSERTRPAPQRTASPEYGRTARSLSHPPEPAPPPIHVDLGGFLGESSPVPPEEVAPAGNGHLPQETAPDLPQGVDDDLDRLKGEWSHIVDQINARSKSMAAVFRDAGQVRPYSVAGKVVTISFRYKMYAERARGEQQRALLESVLSRTLGRPCLVETITFEEEGEERGGHEKGSTRTARPPVEKPPAPHETPRGRAVMNTFGIEKFDEE